MPILDDIKKIASAVSADLKEKKGIYSMESTVAERKAFLVKQKLVYTAKFRIDEDKKQIHFTEMLKETGFGLSTGAGGDISTGFGFKTETYKTGLGPRRGAIEEQSNLFGKKYNYTFDFSAIRKNIEKAANDAGYTFEYQITSAGL